MNVDVMRRKRTGFSHSSDQDLRWPGVRGLGRATLVCNADPSVAGDGATMKH